MVAPIADKERVHLLKNLEHFLSSLLSSKEFYAALIGAVIGGLMTGRYALRAQKQAAEDQRERDLETEERAVEGIRLTNYTVDSLVSVHRGFDHLRSGRRKTGSNSGATNTSMLRATPGCRRISPVRSRVSTIW